jgi:cytochrome c551/c552
MKANVAWLMLACAGPALAAEPPIAPKLEHYRCTICHAEREWLAGPAWADVAQHYRGNRHAAEIVAARITPAWGGGLWRCRTSVAGRRRRDGALHLTVREITPPQARPKAAARTGIDASTRLPGAAYGGCACGPADGAGTSRNERAAMNIRDFCIHEVACVPRTATVAAAALMRRVPCRRLAVVVDATGAEARGHRHRPGHRRGSRRGGRGAGQHRGGRPARAR